MTLIPKRICNRYGRAPGDRCLQYVPVSSNVKFSDAAGRALTLFMFWVVRCQIVRNFSLSMQREETFVLITLHLATPPVYLLCRS